MGHHTRRVVYALDVIDGTTWWSRTVVADEQLVRPIRAKAAGDDPLLVVCASDGTVAVLDLEDGTIRSRTRLDAGIFPRPVAIDLTADGVDDLVAFQGDPRLTAVAIDGA